MKSAIRYTAALILVGMLLQVNCVFVYYGLFHLNQKAIAATVCERKMKSCNGHCFVLKFINSSTQESQQPASGKLSSNKALDDLLNMMDGLQPGTHQHSLTSFDGSWHAVALSSIPHDGFTPPLDHPPNF